MEEENATQAAPAPKRKYATRGRMSESDKLVRDLDAGYKQSRKLLEKSMAECRPGTNSYLAHLKALDDQLLKFAEFRRTVGIIPKNVQNQTVKSFVFKAHAAKGGSVSTVAVSTPAQMQELERSEAKEMKKGYHSSEQDESVRAQFESDFGDGATKGK